MILKNSGEGGNYPSTQRGYLVILNNHKYTNMKTQIDSELMNFIPIRTNDLQRSGNDWQCISATTVMSDEDYYHLIDANNDQNTYVDDDCMLEALPEAIQTELYTNGGKICWSELADTTTWEAISSTVVFNCNDEVIFSQQNTVQK